MKSQKLGRTGSLKFCAFPHISIYPKLACHAGPPFEKQRTVWLYKISEDFMVFLDPQKLVSMLKEAIEEPLLSMQTCC